MWTCTLCTQAKNTQDMDKCMTCGRARDWQPRQRSAATRPQGLPPQEPPHHSSPAAVHVSGHAIRPQPPCDTLAVHGSSPQPPKESQNTQLARARRASNGLEAFRVEQPRTIFGLFWWCICSFLSLFFSRCGTCRRLKIDEQLQVENLNGISVVNGPGTAWVNPFKRSIIVKAERLAGHEYLRIRNTLTSSERTVHGPMLVFLQAYEVIAERGHGLSVSERQYVLVQDKFSGERKVVRGPVVWNPGPREEGHIKSCVRLSCTDYVCIQDGLSGEKKITKGPGQYFPGPYDDWVVGQSIWLSNTQYLKVQDRRTGKLRVDKGPCQWFPGPYDEWEFGDGIWLTGTEYVMVQDKQTGRKRIEKGACQWFPGPYDEWEVATCLTLNNTQYIHVLNKETGVTKIVAGPCTWFPEPYDSPSEVKEAVVLQCDEYVNLKDVSTGERWVHRGRGLLHLQPTWRIESTSGRSGIHKSHALRAREYIRMNVAPHMRVTRPS